MNREKEKDLSGPSMGNRPSLPFEITKKGPQHFSALPNSGEKETKRDKQLFSEADEDRRGKARGNG